MFKNWLYIVFFCFCLGDVGAWYYRKSLFWIFAGIAAFWGLFSACACVCKHRCAEGWWQRFPFMDMKRNLCVLCSMLMLLSGYAAGNGRQQRQEQWQALQGKQIVLEGSVRAESLRKKGQGIAAILEAEKPLRGKVRIFIKTDHKNTDLIAHRLITHRIRMTGVLKEPVYLWNPGAYDGARADRIKGIGGKMTVTLSRLQMMESSVPFPLRFSVLSRNIREEALSRLHSKEGAILPGMILGGYQDVDPEEADVFRDNGIAHLLAVSGTHVAVLTMFLYVLLRPLGAYRLYAVQAVLALYALLCGLQPAVLRAVLMACVLLWGQRRKKRTDSFRLLVLAAWLLLLVEPFWLLDISYQLSFVATAGLLLACPKVTAYLPESWPDWLRSLSGVSLTAQLFSLPFSVFYFHRVSLIGLVSNLLLLPDLEVAALIFLSGLLAQPFLPPVTSLLFPVAEGLLQGAVAAGNVLARLPFAALDVADWGWGGVLCYYAILFAFLDIGPFLLFSSRQRRNWVLTMAAMVCLLVGSRYMDSRQLTIHFMDVGQGDAALIRTPAGQNILIDTGGFTGGGDVARSVLLPYLRYLGVKRIDALCLSHGDHDHAGGAAGLAAKMPVGHIYLGAEAASAEDIKKLLDTIKGKAEVHYLGAGEQWQLGDCRMVVASASSRPSLFSGITNTNSASLILQFFCAGHSIVFPGDADGDTEERSLPFLQQADVLKVGHHGSETSSSPYFLHRLRPRYGIISVGAQNRYGHPSPGALERLQEAGIETLRTDRLGAIKLVFKEDGPHWYSYRYQGNEF